MEDPKVLERIRADWNQRGGEDAYYYVAFGRREQDDEEFFAPAADIVAGLEWNLKRVRGRDAGCSAWWMVAAMRRRGSSCLHLLSFSGDFGVCLTATAHKYLIRIDISLTLAKCAVSDRELILAFLSISAATPS